MGKESVKQADIAEKNVYETPVLNELGSFGDLTKGVLGSSNDGTGVGTGMAGMDDMGGGL